MLTSASLHSDFPRVRANFIGDVDHRLRLNPSFILVLSEVHADLLVELVVLLELVLIGVRHFVLSVELPEHRAALVRDLAIK